MNVSKEYTLYGTIYLLFWIMMALFVASVLLEPFENELAGIISDAALKTIAFMACVYFFGRYFVTRHAIKQRKRHIAEYAKAHNISQTVKEKKDGGRLFKSLSISGLHNVTNYRSYNHLYSEGWAYGDVSYDVRWRIKRSEFKAYTIHYAAMITKLPRILPNVFFDSKKVRGRQFRFHFAKLQLHNLEGDFDNYFATYFPEQYTIDSMSFITPDVMHVLIDASDYDIEIKGDRVCIFGNIRNPNQQIPEMERLLGAIRKQLMDNIVTYRDERIGFEEGRQTVSQIGLRLKRSKFWMYMGVVFIIIYTIGYIILAVIE